MAGVFSTNVPKLSELVSNTCGARDVLQTSMNSKHFSESRFWVKIGLFLVSEVRRGEGVMGRWRIIDSIFTKAPAGRDSIAKDLHTGNARYVF